MFLGSPADAVCAALSARAAASQGRALGNSRKISFELKEVF